MTDLYETGVDAGGGPTGLGKLLFASIVSIGGAMAGGVASSVWSDIPVAGMDTQKSARDAAEYKKAFAKISDEYEAVSRKQYIPGSGVSYDDARKSYVEYEAKKKALALQAFADKDLNESDTRDLLSSYSMPLYSLPKFSSMEVEECRISVGASDAMDIEAKVSKIADCTNARSETSAKVAVYGGGGLGFALTLAYPFFAAARRRKEDGGAEVRANAVVAESLPPAPPPIRKPKLILD